MPFCIGSKFAQNHCVSKGFCDNQHFRFPTKLKTGEIWHFSEAIYQRSLISKRRNSRWPPKVALKWFCEKLPLDSAYTLWVKNFVKIALSRTVKEKEANLCFSIFGKNSKIQNGRHFGERKIFWKLPIVHCLDTLWVENFNKTALSRMV